MSDVPPETRGDLLTVEGLKLTVYQDARGFWTLGVGRCVDSRVKGAGISSVEAMMLLEHDLTRISVGLRTALPWFDALDPARQRALLNAAFNCGVAGLLGFKKMLAAMERRDYDEAAEELLASHAASEAPARYARLAQMLRTGQAA